VVGWEERGSAHCNIISPEPVRSEVAIDPAWIANMLAVGQSLPSAKCSAAKWVSIKRPGSLIETF
jgi:hypothetical protein